ncbi:MAG: ABC transporter substrate-binding protein [Alphaproteobacteria bacterium]
MKARGDYWGDGPYIDQLEFIDLGDDPSASLAALASKQVHGITQVSTVRLDAVQSLPHVQVHKTHTAKTAVVQLMIDKKPFDDPGVTTAIRHATDSDRVVKGAVRGYGLPGEHHFVCPVHPEYAELPVMYGPAKAKALLAEAGYANGIDIELNCKKDPP